MLFSVRTDWKRGNKKCDFREQRWLSLSDSSLKTEKGNGSSIGDNKNKTKN